MNNGRFRKTLVVGIILLFLGTSIVPGNDIVDDVFENEINIDNIRYDDNTMIFHFDFDEPIIEERGKYHIVKMGDLSNYEASGKPVLPFKSLKILLPFGKDIKDIKVTGNEIDIHGEYLIEPGQEAYPTGIDEECNHESIIEPEFTLPDEAVYASVFPGVTYENNGIQLKKGYRILLLTLYPVQHKAGNLFSYDEMTVTVYIKAGSATKNFRGGDIEDILGFDLVNPKIIDTYPKVENRDGETYEYVIITTEEYRDVFQRLADWKSTRGSIMFPRNLIFTAEPNNITGDVNYLNGSVGGGLDIFLDSLSTKVVLLENITGNSSFWYDGFWGDGGDVNIFNDTQCQIRNFIKMAYNNWGTEYVLLGGDADEPVIPCRKMGPLFDRKIPCDMYYGCLDGNWDNDSDGKFGEEPPDSIDDEADLFAEVYIGRAPVDSQWEANNFVNKTIAYENATANNESYLQNALMLGARLDARTEGGNSKDAVTEIIPQYTTTKIYDRDGTRNKSKIIDEMQNGTHIVNYVGHATSSAFFGINKNDAYNLMNDKYFLIYNFGCNAGRFDSDDCIGEHFVTASGGAFAFIGNSRVGWYHYGSINGPSDKFDRSFFKVLMNQSLNASNLGKALQYSKEMMNGHFLQRFIYYTLNLLGDPETQIKTNITTPTARFDTPIDHGQYILLPPTYEGVVNITGMARRGNAPGSTFNHYFIEYGKGLEPTEWSSDGISLVNNGSNEIIRGTLATCDAYQLDSGLHTFRLTVYNNNSRISQDYIKFFIAHTRSVHNIAKDKYYVSIQGAVDDADEGDSIFVGNNRTYYERVIILTQDNLNLIGEDTIIDTYGLGSPTVYIAQYSLHVKFSGFIIDSLNLDRTFESTISGNNIHKIFMTRSGNNIIKNNTIYESSIGISLTNSHGNTIVNNLITNNQKGINSKSSINNLIYNNIFNNTINAHDEGNNIWSITKTLGTNIIGGPYIGGNFWSDSIGDDVDGDGIGDTPYDVPPDGRNVDQLPLWKLKPAFILSARSGRDHAGIMYWLDLDSSNHIEPRLGGMELIEFNLSCSVSLVSASVECLINQGYDPTISVAYVDQDTIEVHFDPPLPDQDVSLITLGGNASDSYYARVLTGDIYYDGIIAIEDIWPIMDRLGQIVTTSNFRYDINTDGFITSSDYASVKQRLGNTCPNIQ